MRRSDLAKSFAVLSVVLAAPPAFAQIAGTDYQSSDFTSFSTEFRIDAGLVARAGDADGALAEIDAQWQGEYLAQSGRRLRLVLGVRGERDSRPGLTLGPVGNCPSGTADCASLQGAAVSPAVQSPASGLYTHGRMTGRRDRLALDAAYISVSSGWGEWRAGYGPGAARIDAVSGPSAFRLSRADTTRLHSNPLSVGHTENRLSGFSPKLVFHSIALGQEATVGTLRVAASWAPNGDDCDTDMCGVADRVPNLTYPVADQVVELGALYALRRGEHEWQVSLGLAAGLETPAGLGSAQAIDVGASWRRGNWLAGASVLRADAGAGDNALYQAWSGQLGYEVGPWIYVFEHAAFSDDWLHVDGKSWQIGASRLVGDNWLVGAGLQTAERDEPVITPIGRRQQRHRADVVFVELGWQF
ncbi:porin [Maricaulis sp. CAU 1757]